MQFKRIRSMEHKSPSRFAEASLTQVGNRTHTPKEPDFELSKTKPEKPINLILNVLRCL